MSRFMCDKKGRRLSIFAIACATPATPRGKEHPMRFIVMHKVDAHMESGGPPSQDIIKNMGALVQESIRSHIFTTGAGLHRSAKRARLDRGGQVVTKGPYSGQNELVESFAMIRAASLDEAVERAREFARVLDAEIEVGPVVEPWDLGVMPKPTGNTPGRFLLLCKGDAATERGGEPLAARRAKLAELVEALKKEGVLLMSDRLAPSARGARLSKGGTLPGVGASAAAGNPPKRSWVDGPFAESKELIAGFSVLELPSRADAIAWADRYAAVLGDNEVDVRELE
jgi:hypothetical protein